MSGEREREREGGKESRAIVFCLHFFFPFPSSSLRLTSSQSLSYFSFISHRLLLLVVVVVKDQLFFLYCAVFYYRWACDRWPIVFWLSSIVVRLFFCRLRLSVCCVCFCRCCCRLCVQQTNKQCVPFPPLPLRIRLLLLHLLHHSFSISIGHVEEREKR